jgi:hypothetical protein
MKARFHLPDFSKHYAFNIIFAEMLQVLPDYFREGVEIASFYGVFPPSIWNGGRTQGGVCDSAFVKRVIKEFNDRGIPLRFTFTNPALEKKHLSDPFCNMVMNLANNGLNEAIVLSPLLEDYIRKNYPKYKLTSSTCKRITDPEKLGQYFQGLGLLYAFSVVLTMGMGGEAVAGHVGPVLDKLLRGVIVNNEQALRHMIKTMP